jgi:hypothetical protein
MSKDAAMKLGVFAMDLLLLGAVPGRTTPPKTLALLASR